MSLKNRKISILIAGVALPLLLIVGTIRFYQEGDEDLQVHEAERVQKIQDFRKMLIEPLGPHLLQNKLVREVDMTLDTMGVGLKQTMQIDYTIDQNLQTEADKLLKSYKPDYGAIVILDTATGRILALASFQRDDQYASNLALRATYPAASIFKIVTATAALDKYELSPDTLVMYNGGNHTLYKKKCNEHDCQSMDTKYHVT